MNASQPADTELGLSRPENLRDLFWSFTRLALQGFGGVVAIVQRELVEEKKWMTREQFLEDWSVAQILPGANVVNLSLMIGDRYFGMRGALVALAGMLAFPMLVVILVALAFAGVADSPHVQGALTGLGAVAAGLIAATGLKLAAALGKNIMGSVVCWFLVVVTIVAIAAFRVPLIAVLVVAGGPAWVWAYRQLRKTALAKDSE
ncbi:chromate transporter [Rhodoferax sp. PAMC 29310]|uniref:chromate transporter n=1 Tax=Rhodoferax sp. PAMC 29310 TaxID=2822760 RepID=UPI001B32B98E|nr:chromate transporter [Rhodoferax sp. PAMC 29310]